MLSVLCQLPITLVTLQTKHLVAACPCMLGCEQVSGGCAQRAIVGQCSGQAGCHLLHIVNHQGFTPMPAAARWSRMRAVGVEFGRQYAALPHMARPCQKLNLGICIDANGKCIGDLGLDAGLYVNQILLRCKAAKHDLVGCFLS